MSDERPYPFTQQELVLLSLAVETLLGSKSQSRNILVAEEAEATHGQERQQARQALRYLDYQIEQLHQLAQKLGTFIESP